MSGDTTELEVKSASLTDQARALVIVDEPGYRAADDLGRAAKALLAAIDESYDPIISKAHEAHKAAIEAKRKQAAPVEEVKRLVAAKMGEWYRAEQARLAEERRKAEEEARRRAEEEALARAEELAAAGLHEAADVALAEPVVERVAVPEAPKLDGVSYRTSYSAEVLDLMALVKAVASGAAPMTYVAANMTALNADARTHKDALKIPGVRVRAETTQTRR